MITADQIRAGRGLLNWTQKELARRSGMSLQALNNLERESVLPRPRTLALIRNALEAAGIEFLGDSGIRKKEQLFEFRHLKGSNFLDFTAEDQIQVLTPSTELLTVGVNEELFRKHSSGEDRKWIAHMRKTKIRKRSLVATGTTFFTSDPSNYRYLSPELIGCIYWFTYADRLVIVNWESPAHAMWIRNASIAETYQRQFEGLWRLGTAIPEYLARNVRDRE